MKRFLLILLAVAMILLLASCGDKSGSTQSGQTAGELTQQSERQSGKQRGSRPEGTEGAPSRQKPAEGETAQSPGSKIEKNGENVSQPKDAAAKPNEKTADNRESRQQQSNDGKTLTATVQSIVGNEVTLLMTNDGQEQTETLLLPVGMKIGSKDFSSVKAGNTLKITFGADPDDGTEIITSVEIASGGRK